MPIIEATISAEILTSLQKNSEERDVEKAKKALADDLAKAIANAIKSAQVDPGIPVSTAGGPTAQTGSTTAPGTLS